MALRLQRNSQHFPDIGPIIFEDSETGEQLYVDTHDKKFRKRFIEAAQQREYKLNVVLHRVGVDELALSTEDDLVAEIVRFAMLRKQRKRAPASFAKSKVGSLSPQRN